MSKNATISLSSFSAMFGVFCMNDFLFMCFIVLTTFYNSDGGLFAKFLASFTK